MRAERTSAKKRMEDAYIFLLTKKNYREITVADVTREAKVARVSFYRSFKTFDELLGGIFDDFYERATKDILPMFLEDRKGAWHKLLLNTYIGIKEQKIIHFNILPENSAYLFGRLERRFGIREMVKTRSVSEKYLPIVNIGIMFSCAKAWADGGFVETPEELAEFVYGIIVKNIADE